MLMASQRCRMTPGLRSGGTGASVSMQQASIFAQGQQQQMQALQMQLQQQQQQHQQLMQVLVQQTRGGGGGAGLNQFDSSPGAGGQDPAYRRQLQDSSQRSQVLARLGSMRPSPRPSKSPQLALKDKEADANMPDSDDSEAEASVGGCAQPLKKGRTIPEAVSKPLGGSGSVEGASDAIALALSNRAAVAKAKKAATKKAAPKTVASARKTAPKAAAAAAKKAATKTAPKPSWGWERTRGEFGQIMCRSGSKGPGSTFRILVKGRGRKYEQEAIREADAWVAARR